MGILLSVIQYLGGETDDEENERPRNPLIPRANAISSPNSYDYYSNTGDKSEYARRNNILASSHQWQNGIYSTDSQQKKNLTIYVPNLRCTSSLAHTSVNDKVNTSAIFIKEDTPQNVCHPEKIGMGSSAGVKGEEIEIEGGQVMINCKVAPPPEKIGMVSSSGLKGEEIEIGGQVMINGKVALAPEKIGMRSSSGVKGEEIEIEEGQVMINCKVVPPPEGRWIKHYSSCHRILLVGEGDFSFSTCLAAAFGWASNMVATSLDSEAFLVRNYQNALSNLVELSIRKCKVMHEINATKMANHAFLGGIKFDRIIFNFPFAGFFKDLSRDSQLRRHRRLVSLFLKNAKEMISENGEIHISHKTNDFHIEWKLESVASSHGLRLVEAVDFNHLDYPRYNTKRGFGGDDNFNCHPSKTYKFGLKCC